MYAICNTGLKLKLEEVKRNGKKSVIISVRTTKENSEWMKEHEISPTLLFNKAVEELREKEDEK